MSVLVMVRVWCKKCATHQEARLRRLQPLTSCSTASGPETGPRARALPRAPPPTPARPRHPPHAPSTEQQSSDKALNCFQGDHSLLRKVFFQLYQSRRSVRIFMPLFPCPAARRRRKSRLCVWVPFRSA